MPDSKTLLQAILAAFCAILCALSSLGGGGMMIGARTAAWAKSGYTAKDYVQDGLIAMWDGIENAGWGVHDSNPSAWKNLAGIIDLTTNAQSVARDDHFDLTLTTSAFPFLNAVSSTFSDLVSLETVLKINSSRESWIFQLSNYSGLGFGVKNNNLMIGYQSSSYGGWDKAAINVESMKDDRFSFGSFTDRDTFKDTCYVNADLANKKSFTRQFFDNPNHLWFRSYYMNYSHQVEMYSLRFYNRFLTESEIAANYAIDKARFNLT